LRGLERIVRLEGTDEFEGNATNYIVDPNPRDNTSADYEQFEKELPPRAATPLGSPQQTLTTRRSTPLPMTIGDWTRSAVDDNET